MGVIASKYDLLILALLDSTSGVKATWTMAC